MDAFRSSTSRRFYSSMSLALFSAPASKTPVTNTYYWSNQGKITNEFSLRKMLIEGPVPTPCTIVQHSFRLTFRKGRMVSSLLLSISRALIPIHVYLYPLSFHMTTFALFLSYLLNPTNCSFHRILTTVLHHL